MSLSDKIFESATTDPSVDVKDVKAAVRALKKKKCDVILGGFENGESIEMIKIEDLDDEFGEKLI